MSKFPAPLRHWTKCLFNLRGAKFFTWCVHKWENHQVLRKEVLVKLFFAATIVHSRIWRSGRKMHSLPGEGVCPTDLFTGVWSVLIIKSTVTVQSLPFCHSPLHNIYTVSIGQCIYVNVYTQDKSFPYLPICETEHASSCLDGFSCNHTLNTSFLSISWFQLTVNTATQVILESQKQNVAWISFFPKASKVFIWNSHRQSYFPCQILFLQPLFLNTVSARSPSRISGAMLLSVLTVQLQTTWEVAVDHATQNTVLACVALYSAFNWSS